MVLKLQTRPHEALVEGQRLVCDEERNELADNLGLLGRVLELRFQVVWFAKVRVDRFEWLDEELVEQLATPLPEVASAQ